jgi:tetratricopeptide (TPR) repeat protein
MGPNEHGQLNVARAQCGSQSRSEREGESASATQNANLATTIADHRRTDPRRLIQSIRGELDWIVMKCLEKDRNRRYESAGSLARDVERYLNDKPVLACPPSVAYRFRKFARRNRTALITTVALSLLLLVGSAVSARLIWAAYNREVRARGAEAIERQRAEENLTLALEALDAVLLRHAEAQFGSDPDPRGLDSDVMQKGLQFYEHVAARNSDDPAVRLAAAVAYMRVGVIQSQLGEVSKADDAGRQAIAMFETLPPEIASSPECRRHLIECYFQQGFRLSAPNKEKAFRQAIAYAENLVAEYPDIPEHWHLLAISQSHFGEFLARSERTPESEPHIRRALDAFERISDYCSKTPEYQMARARVYTVLKEFLTRQNRTHDAELACLQALALEEQVARDFPDFAWQRQHGHSLRQLADTIWPLGRLEEAEAVFAKAAQLFEQLADEFPNVPQHRHFAADSHRNIGDIQMKLNRHEQAEQSYSKAIAIFESLPSDFVSKGFVVQSDDPQLADAWHARGDTYLQRGEYAKAAADFAKALELRPDFEMAIAHRYHDAAIALWKKGRFDDAERVFREALFRKQNAVDASPKDPDGSFHVAHTYLGLATLLNETGKPQEAATLIHEAIAILNRLTAEAPTNEDFAKLLEELQQKELTIRKQQKTAGEDSR